MLGSPLPPLPDNQADEPEGGEDEAGGLASRLRRSQRAPIAGFDAIYVSPRDRDRDAPFASR